MIFHQHIKTASGKIWIADATQNGFVKLDDESRQEYEARFLYELIQRIFGDVELDHESNGAPFIKNRSDLHISISHSENWFALYVSDEQPVGIDIEINSDQIKKTEMHFLTQKEIKDLQPAIAELRICWGIKESVFKKYRGDMKSMKEEIEIVSIDQNRAKAKFQNRIIKLNHQQTEAFTLVYTE